MNMFLKIAAVLAFAAPLAGISGVAHAAPATSHVCTVAGSIWIEQLDACVLRVTDVAEINKVTPADTANDPMCEGKPVGWKYDTHVVGPNGMKGVAHHVCGVRPQ